MKLVLNQMTNVYYIKYNGQIEKIKLVELDNIKMCCLLDHLEKEPHYLLICLLLRIVLLKKFTKSLV